MLKDLQSEKDFRNISINDIGICDYKLPFIFLNKSKKFSTIATLNGSVTLGKDLRGAHLSRIIEVLNEEISNKEVSLEACNKIIFNLSTKAVATNCSINMNFDIIVEDVSPVRKKVSYKTINVNLNIQKKDEKILQSLTLGITGAMLCPCSKEISEYGAHNQKCEIEVTLFGNIIDLDVLNIIDIVEQCFSCKVYSTVKREDEKYMTEHAYNNPKFSEDLIRDVLLKVNEIYKEGKIVVKMKNYESIHQHNVFAIGEMNN